jgi:hypothetical protein
VHYRQILPSLALTFLLTATPTVAAPNGPSNDYNSQQPALSTPTQPSEASVADRLVKALNHRLLDLGQRFPATPAPAPAEAQAPRARLSSRMSGPASHRTNPPSSPASNLVDYLGILSRTTPGGIVTGRFSDWRSPSVYRAVGGRHNGYDVALRAGSRVVVGWPGRVSSIVNWYGREYGITVVSPDGFHTTYGHLSPGVRVGQWLEPGDVVGIVVHDHVDIKMRNAHGHPIDFAHGVPLIAHVGDKPVASALVAGAPGYESRLFPPLAGPDWTQRPDPVRAALNYVNLRIQEASLMQAGVTAPPAMLGQVRKQLAEARKQLLVEEVPEEVLLAAFLDGQKLETTFAVSDPRGASDTNPLAEWLHKEQKLKEARQSVPALQDLLKDLQS